MTFSWLCSSRPAAFVFAASLLFAITCAHAQAAELNTQQEARYRALVQELRCLVCQNQSIAESNAPLAEDLRSQVKSQILDGRSDGDIVGYLTARYGDFVLYRPRFGMNTVLLWLAPVLLVFLGVALALRLAFKRREPRTSTIDRDALQRLLGDAEKRRR